MQFDATLNLAWAILGLFALAATAHVALRQKSRGRAPRWLLVVGLIVTALFPYISASDDMLRLGSTENIPAVGTINHAGSNFALSNASREQSPSKERHQTDDLLRLYDTLDTPLICRLIAIAFSFLLIALIAVTTCARAMRIAPDVAGRSPPTAIA